ncbi:hypothetical protein Tco_0799576 [Tanacetum coccineum]|uniref:Uncharacterized protein n=1 Tax=Tanacetum coccineum TaxID=301880 RepID=A0ABQ4ZQP3_9ASTR
MEYSKNEEDSFTNLETKYLAIVFDNTSDTALSWEPTVSPLDNNEIDFEISFDESDDEDYMVVFDENSFSCKIIYVDNLKTDSKIENDKVNTPSSPSLEPTIGYIEDLDFLKDFKNEFPAIAYNDLKPKLDPLIEPSVSSQHINKFETSLSEYDKKEQNVLYLDPKTIEDNDDNIDITQSSRNNVINIDTNGSNELPKTNHDKIDEVFNDNFFIITLDANIVFNIWKAFGGNTRDLGSFGEETDKTTDLHQHLSRISTQKLETASQITRDAVTTHLKTASQDLQTASDCTTQPII